MEISKSLATESFSYSWLIDRKPSSYDHLLNNLTPTFSENSNEKEHNFNFDVPTTTSDDTNLVHADEIFSDGHIMPVYVHSSKVETSLIQTSTSVPTTSPIPLYDSRGPFISNTNQCYFLEKWRKLSSKRILQKCFGLFMNPLCKRIIGSSKKSNRVDDLERKVFEIRSWGNPTEVSPRQSSAYSVVEWADDDVKKIGINSFDLYHGLEKVKNLRTSANASPILSPSRSSNAWFDDAENSIHEAILYCKKSIEK